MKIVSKSYNFCSKSQNLRHKVPTTGILMASSLMMMVAVGVAKNSGACPKLDVVSWENFREHVFNLDSRSKVVSLLDSLFFAVFMFASFGSETQSVGQQPTKTRVGATALTLIVVFGYMCTFGKTVFRFSNLIMLLVLAVEEKKSLI